MSDKTSEKKTNAVRELEAAGCAFRTHSYDPECALAGVEVAALLHQNPDAVFKTLVTQGKSGAHYVFMVPVACSLDVKRAAKAVGEKSIEMVKSKDLLGLTGYIHGGCSPVGMKKPFITACDETAQLFGTIIFSGGRRGLQLEMSPLELARFMNVRFADLVEHP